LEENLSKGFIWASCSLAGTPILFMKKDDGSLWLCVDYQGLNEGTIKTRYPLPLLHKTLLQLQKVKYYTKLDIWGAYNLVRMAKGEEWKIAFRTMYGLFESLVMPFGLTNAPASFQHFINDVLWPYLDIFIIAYLDNILIYSDNLNDHWNHVLKVLEALSEASLYLKLEKCEFHQQEVKYLGFIISTSSTKMDPAKVATIQEWPIPRNMKHTQSFQGFANFYRCFVQGYSNIVTPMTQLTRKNTCFVWSEECLRSFESLKQAFTTALVLWHFDYDHKIIVETDASNYVSTSLLSQYNDDGILHPVAFFSKKHSPAECNYKIYDKELMAIVWAFEEWRLELEGTLHPIQVLSDHKNLEYFISTKLLNCHQTHWAEYLSCLNFKIVYCPGKAGGKPDALTHRSGDLPKVGDKHLVEQQKAVLKPHNLPDELQILAIYSPSNTQLPLNRELAEAIANDTFAQKILSILQDGKNHCQEIILLECQEYNSCLLYQGCQYIPPKYTLRLCIIQCHHDVPAAGHPGRAKTFDLIKRQYYSPSLRKDVECYVANCHTCQRTKASRHQPYGVLHPLPVPQCPWRDISIDVVTGLPSSNGFDAIWVVVDRLTKLRHFVPCSTTIDAEGLAELSLSNIFRLHGLPETIVSDHGPQFSSRLWKHLCHALKIEPCLSTAFYPETDSQTEHTNAIMEQYLRAYVNYQQDNWVWFLPMAEFAANNHISETTSISPFFANYGLNPKIDFELEIQVDNHEEG
jgi:hypothetical protein